MNVYFELEKISQLFDGNEKKNKTKQNDNLPRSINLIQ